MTILVENSARVILKGVTGPQRMWRSGPIVRGTKALAAAALLALAACVESAPSEADVARALPPVTMDSAMAAFQRVCVASKPDFATARARQASLASPGAYVFETDTLSNGAPVCTMRARLPAGQDAFRELQRRYGPARGPAGSLLTVFNGYPGGQLVFMHGIRGGAGEGTFQVGLVSGQTF